MLKVIFSFFSSERVSPVRNTNLLVCSTHLQVTVFWKINATLLSSFQDVFSLVFVYIILAVTPPGKGVIFSRGDFSKGRLWCSLPK